MTSRAVLHQYRPNVRIKLNLLRQSCRSHFNSRILRGTSDHADSSQNHLGECIVNMTVTMLGK